MDKLVEVSLQLASLHIPWRGIYLVKTQSAVNKSKSVSRCIILPGIALPQDINTAKSLTHRSRKGELPLT